jgi:hypothetical protein
MLTWFGNAGLKDIYSIRASGKSVKQLFEMLSSGIDILTNQISVAISLALPIYGSALHCSMQEAFVKLHFGDRNRPGLLPAIN